MQINRNNAEAFFLDYYEGNLSEGQVAELFAFLKANPDLRETFEAFGDVNVTDTESRIQNSDSRTPDFSFLKKESDSDIHAQAEQWMVDSVEGTITEADRNSLEKYFETNPAKRKELELLQKTILRADANEVFGDLSSLKKNAEITAGNFADFAIADVEGTISVSDKTKLAAFVAANPEFAQELALFRATKLNTAESRIPGPDFSFLKKTPLVVTEDNIMELLVAKAEGELSASDNAAVEEYIARFPEYKTELEAIGRTKLQPDTSVVFEGKENLRKGIFISESNFEQYAISAAEGLLNSEELKAFNAFVAANPKYKKQAAAFAAVRLQPDMSVVFEDKASLKRKDRAAVIWWTVSMRYAAAAIVVIVFGIYLFTQFGGGGTDPIDPYAFVDSANKNNDGIIVNPGVKNNDGIAEVNTNNNNNSIVAPVNYSNVVIPDTAEVPLDVFVAETKPYDPAVLQGQQANDGVEFSTALYVALDNQPVQPASSSEYITPGQFAMRWMKSKIDAGNPQFGTGDDQPENPGDVDGLDLTESAVNRIGQTAAKGNVSMQQKDDGTYLQLWKYSVRVSSKAR